VPLVTRQDTSSARHPRASVRARSKRYVDGRLVRSCAPRAWRLGLEQARRCGGGPRRAPPFQSGLAFSLRGAAAHDARAMSPDCGVSRFPAGGALSTLRRDLRTRMNLVPRFHTLFCAAAQHHVSYLRCDARRSSSIPSPGPVATAWGGGRRRAPARSSTTPRWPRGHARGSMISQHSSVLHRCRFFL